MIDLRDTIMAALKTAGPLESMDTLCNDLVAALSDAPADLVRRLLADHQRVEPHHADQCQLCREATAAIDGQPAQSNSHQIAVKQPAPGERQPIDRDDLMRAAQRAGFGVAGGFVMPPAGGHITAQLEAFAALIGPPCGQ